MIRQPKYSILRSQSNEQLWKYEERIHKVLFKKPEIKRILEHKGNKCYFCSFHDPLFIEPHHLDGNHDNNSTENIVPACTLCHRQHHLLWLSQYSHAVFGLFKDNITQTNLNHIQRLMLVLNNHKDQEIRKLYSRKGELGGFCFDAPISLHQRRRFTDFSEFEFQQMMCEDVKAYINYQKSNQLERNNDSIDSVKSINKNSSMNFFQGDIDDLSYLNRAEGEDDQAALERKQKFQEQLVRYKDWFRESIKDNKNFSLFQLGMALNQCSLNSYLEFKLPNILLCFKESIFTEDQIKYYLTRADFDISHAKNSFNQAELLNELKKDL